MSFAASNETAAMKTSALSAISQAGAINAEQMLRLVQSNLKKSDDGSVKVLDGGVEQDINVYLAKLKNPGSGYEHHFKPSAQAGMGAKPTTGTAGAAGVANPWLEGSMNLTKQMALEATDPDLAAVLKREPVTIVWRRGCDHRKQSSKWRDLRTPQTLTLNRKWPHHFRIIPAVSF